MTILLPGSLGWMTCLGGSRPGSTVSSHGAWPALTFVACWCRWPARTGGHWPRRPVRRPPDGMQRLLTEIEGPRSGGYGGSASSAVQHSWTRIRAPGLLQANGCERRTARPRPFCSRRMCCRHSTFVYRVTTRRSSVAHSATQNVDLPRRDHSAPQFWRVIALV